jgi:hypothetical protein
MPELPEEKDRIYLELEVAKDRGSRSTDRAGFGSVIARSCPQRLAMACKSGNDY